MKRIPFALFLFLISVLSFNCQKEFSHQTIGITGTGNRLPDPVIATLQGNILDENGQPADAVRVTVGSKTATTNSSGYFRIIDGALDKNASLVTAEKPGYFKAQRSFNATSAVNQVVIKLIKKILAGTVSATAGGDITLSNGAKISLPAKGVVKEQDGLSFTGNINVYAAYIDPTATDISETIPGSFMANDKTNRRVTLKSYGMMAVVLESALGEKLQIEKNNTAKLTTPIPASLQSAAPSTISLWYIDEQTGLWKEEGNAIKNGTAYVGDVKHFTFWNSDLSADSAVKLSFTLKNATGAPVVYASVFIKSSTRGQAYGYTDSLGQVSGIVPANEDLALQVTDPCGAAVYTKNIGPFVQDTNLGNIVVENTNPSIVTVLGKLTDCNNAAVTSGYAIISFDNIIRYAGVNSNGDFSSTFVLCSGNPATCQILGIDALTRQQGLVINESVSSPVINAGNISACGVSTLEVIKYSLDGTDYNLANTFSADSLLAYSYPIPAPFLTTTITGYRANSGINFNFINNGAAGVFPVNKLSVMGFDNAVFIQPFDVSLTAYPQNIGEFYEGNFSGQFKDSLNLSSVHKISCSFRLKKYY